MRIFPQHTHIHGFHDLQLTPKSKPNKTTLRRTYLNSANRPYWQVKTISSALFLTLVWCDVSSSVSLKCLGWIPSKSDSRGYRQVWEHSRRRPIHTQRVAKKLRLFSDRACQQDWGPPVCDWWPGFCILLKLTRVGSIGWESSLLYLVNIILIIFLTNPAALCMYVCACACACVRTQGGVFSMPSVVQVCVMKSWVLFWKPSEFQPFSHLRFFSQLPLFSPSLSHGTVHPRLLTA